jgi:hypothetical protein
MHAQFTALRAATGLYSIGLLRKIFLIGCGLFILLLIVISLLAYYISAWWWLFSSIPVIIFIIFCGALLIARIIVKKVVPGTITILQKNEVKDFNNKVSIVIAHMQTNYFLIAYHLLKDVIIHHEARELKKLIQDSSQLKSDFVRLVSFFE